MHCGNENMMVSLYHVILQKHVMKGYLNLWIGDS